LEVIGPEMNHHVVYWIGLCAIVSEIFFDLKLAGVVKTNCSCNSAMFRAFQKTKKKHDLKGCV